MADLKYQAVLDSSAKVTEDVAQYHGVALDGNGDAGYPAAKGDRIQGVLLSRYGTDERARIIEEGIVPIKIKTAGTLAVGDLVACDVDGQFAAGIAGEEASAILREAPASDGDIVQAYISPAIRSTF